MTEHCLLTIATQGSQTTIDGAEQLYCHVEKRVASREGFCAATRSDRRSIVAFVSTRQRNGSNLGEQPSAWLEHAVSCIRFQDIVREASANQAPSGFNGNLA